MAYLLKLRTDPLDRCTRRIIEHRVKYPDLIPVGFTAYASQLAKKFDLPELFSPEKLPEKNPEEPSLRTRVKRAIVEHTLAADLASAATKRTLYSKCVLGSDPVLVDFLSDTIGYKRSIILRAFKNHFPTRSQVATVFRTDKDRDGTCCNTPFSSRVMHGLRDCPHNDRKTLRESFLQSLPPEIQNLNPNWTSIIRELVQTEDPVVVNKLNLHLWKTFRSPPQSN